MESLKGLLVVGWYLLLLSMPLIADWYLASQSCEKTNDGRCAQRLQGFLVAASELSRGTRFNGQEVKFRFGLVDEPEKDHLIYSMANVTDRYALTLIPREERLTSDKVGSLDELFSSLDENIVQVTVKREQAIGLTTNHQVSLIQRLDGVEKTAIKSQQVKSLCRGLEKPRDLVAVLDHPSAKDSVVLALQADKKLIRCLSTLGQNTLLPVIVGVW